MNKKNYIRNLDVPYFSQRNNRYEWKKRTYNAKTNEFILASPHEKEFLAADSCNVTCLAMVLNYLGVTSDTPDEMLKKIFEPSDLDKTNNELLDLKKDANKGNGYTISNPYKYEAILFGIFKE